MKFNKNEEQLFMEILRIKSNFNTISLSNVQYVVQQIQKSKSIIKILSKILEFNFFIIAVNANNGDLSSLSWQQQELEILMKMLEQNRWKRNLQAKAIGELMQNC